MSDPREFEFEVSSHRWDREKVYRLRRTAGGWFVDAPSVTGEGGKSASPFLYEGLKRDGFGYPSDLPDYFNRLWNLAEEKRLGFEEVQIMLQDLADWVTLCEKNRPWDWVAEAGPGSHRRTRP